MKRFKNILLVHSDRIGSDEALSRATALAKSNAARLTIADVVRDSDATPMLLAERERCLSRLLTTVKHEGVDATAIVVAGTPFLEITRQVLREGHDLLIMVADSDSPDHIRRLFFGSTSMHLMRKCPCPVWVLKAQRRPRQYRKILAPVAIPVGEMEPDDHNVMILDFATSLAHTEGSELHVLHAWDFTGADADTIRSEITDGIRDRLFHKHESIHSNWMEELLARDDLKKIQHHVHLVRGRAESTITNMVEKNEIDLIVMGTVCRTGIPGFFIGNTAEYVLSRVHCSVLTMKPSGFASPVTLGP